MYGITGYLLHFLSALTISHILLLKTPKVFQRAHIVGQNVLRHKLEILVERRRVLQRAIWTALVLLTTHRETFVLRNNRNLNDTHGSYNSRLVSRTNTCFFVALPRRWIAERTNQF